MERYLTVEEVEALKPGDSWTAIEYDRFGNRSRRVQVRITRTTKARIWWTDLCTEPGSALKRKARILARPTAKEIQVQCVKELRHLLAHNLSWEGVSEDKLREVYRAVTGKEWAVTWTK